MKAYTKPVLEVVELVSADRFADDSLTIYTIGGGAADSYGEGNFSLGTVLSNATEDPIDA